MRAPLPTGGRRATRFAELKNALAEGRIILWADESAFYLLPALRRTWAPMAQTPVIRRRLSREHLSAISAIGAISMTGELYWSVQERAYRSAGVIGFLQQLRDWMRYRAAPADLGWGVRPFHSSQPGGIGVFVAGCGAAASAGTAGGRAMRRS